MLDQSLSEKTGKHCLEVEEEDQYNNEVRFPQDEIESRSEGSGSDARSEESKKSSNQSAGSTGKELVQPKSSNLSSNMSQSEDEDGFGGFDQAEWTQEINCDPADIEQPEDWGNFDAAEDTSEN